MVVKAQNDGIVMAFAGKCWHTELKLMHSFFAGIQWDLLGNAGILILFDTANTCNIQYPCFDFVTDHF